MEGVKRGMPSGVTSALAGCSGKVAKIGLGLLDKTGLDFADAYGLDLAEI